jgi:hypothetical protein
MITFQNKFTNSFFVTVCLLFFLLASGCHQKKLAEFSDSDITAIKLQIIEEFEKRPGVEVSSVNLVKESRNKLTGFIKLKAFGYEDFKNCSATMGEDTTYIWQCN